MKEQSEQRLGLLQWLRPGEYSRAEELLRDMQELGIRHLRTGLSWADYHTAEGKKWFDWLVPKLARQVELLPCFTYTPPSLAVEPKSSAPPRRPKDYADFIDTMISAYGDHFEWVELWNEPNNLNDWDWRLDPNWEVFSEMIGMAAHWARQRGKKPVLAGMCPMDPNWLELMCDRGVVDQMQAIGLHGFPGTWEFSNETWQEKIEKMRAVLHRKGCDPQIWLTEVGYSTWRHDEINQAEHLVAALGAPVDRLYWYSGYDLHPHQSHQDGFHEDERHYHFGLKTADGSPKLIYRFWKEQGLDGLKELAQVLLPHRAGLTRDPDSLNEQERAFSRRIEGEKNGSWAREEGEIQAPAALPSSIQLPRLESVSRRTRTHERPILITGGAGFVGTNLAQRLLSEGHSVLLLDNLGRSGVERNLKWLCRHHGPQVQFEIADVRDRHLVRAAVQRCSRIYHFAAQVAVTTSLVQPRTDFDVNLGGTLNVLEAMREMKSPPPLLFTSTNKVYGDLNDLKMNKSGQRYVPTDPLAADGISELRALDFHSPYGCSKGAADQYVLDYARTYGLMAVVFRMSCIYGPHQFGTEDQGWVAHFLIQALKKRPITLFGDGCQVRDILFVDDLTRAMELALDNVDALSGSAFNIGGGPGNSVSLLELLDRIQDILGHRIELTFDDWRTGDQKYFVTNTGRFAEATGWSPRTNVQEGLRNLHDWLVEHVVPQRPRPPLMNKERSLQYASTR